MYLIGISYLSHSSLWSGADWRGGRKPLLGLGWWVVRGWLLLAPCCLGAFLRFFHFFCSIYRYLSTDIFQYQYQPVGRSRPELLFTIWHPVALRGVWYFLPLAKNLTFIRSILISYWYFWNILFHYQFQLVGRLRLKLLLSIWPNVAWGNLYFCHLPKVSISIYW